jgi:hypothetical protein
MENCPFIVDLPIKNGDFPVRYVSLPEGINNLPIFTWLVVEPAPRINMSSSVGRMIFPT